MFLSLFEHFDTFPELYGTCGELYVVEDLKPLDVPHLLGKLAFLHRDVPMKCKIPEIMGRARDKGRKPVKKIESGKTKLIWTAEENIIFEKGKAAKTVPVRDT